jgi:hypothetical protein
VKHKAMLDQLVSDIRAAKNRSDAARVYAVALATFSPSVGEPWQTLGKAILERWSMSGLRYIKEQAWMIQQPKQGAGQS